MAKNYVNNRDLLEHIIKRRNENAIRLANGEDKLPIDDYLGFVIMEIAKRLSYRPNFINYSFKDEMIGDAIENGLKVIDNFDPSKSSNPFAYITQIMWNAFIRRILIEQKQQKIKGALISEMPLEELFEIQDHDEDGIQYSHHMMDYLRDNNFMQETQEKEIKVKQANKGLEKFFEE
jgi:DNA-directed RNA polymerase specialized sigma24 family protein